MKRRSLKPEERRIWAKVAQTVTQRPGRALPAIEPEPQPVRKTPGPPSAPKPKEQLPGLVRFAAGAPAPAWPPFPQERSGEKRVRRGRIEIDGRLDLHGMTQIQARLALALFLHRLQADGGRCGLVITGKGRVSGGDGAGVLRRRLPEWLAEPDLAALGAGYAPAHPRHGGEGAWYVFVKRKD